MSGTTKRSPVALPNDSLRKNASAQQCAQTWGIATGRGSAKPAEMAGRAPPTRGAQNLGGGMGSAMAFSLA